jgi:ubiquinone/menaquinone biosynthesis C-methylase UbiE
VFAIAERLRGAGHVYAIDVQRDLLRKVKNEAEKHGYNNVEVIWCDLERPRASKIADQKLDLVLISNLLFQIENKAAVFSEAWRILKPSGHLAVIDWTDSFGGMGPIRQDVVTKEKALALGKDAGFELQREFDAGAHHYGLIFKLVPRQK